MSGWEEAGAVWAEATRTPAASARLPTAATKDLRLIVRDRSQLLALVAMPVIFIGVQVFGAAGWGWATASLERVSWFAYSLALYMGTIGPLTHMQAERRAFWILLTVPVPLGRLLAAKARAWALLIGGLATLVYTVMSLSVPHASVAERLGAGLLVSIGAAGISFIAVAMASAGADLSDETNTAVGPATIYGYLRVGGLYNLVLVEDALTCLAGLALYVFAGWAYWQAGVEQAAFCLDAEMVRARRVRAADGATMLIVLALGGRALVSSGKLIAEGGEANGPDALAQVVIAVLQVGLLALIGAAAHLYLRRRPAGRARRRLVPSLLLGAVAGGGAGALLRASAGPSVALPPEAITVGIVMVLVQELVLRGVVQRAIQEHFVGGPGGGWRERSGAAAISIAAGVVTSALWLHPMAMAGVLVLAGLAYVQLVAAAVYSSTGRVAASMIAHAVIVAIVAFA
jgi:hypothetical protein